ncbi:MAG TPA: hypothetical protein VH021_20880 [Trebonia sp.]|nr:hypothetical protein [Trebonia sp.]
MDSSEERLIAETAQANRALGAGGQGDMVWGHASIRDPNQRGVWMEESAEIAAALKACRKLAADGVIPGDLRSAPDALAAAVAALRSSGLIPPDGPDPIAAAVDYSYLA